jgi:multidrug resistance protein, MATE family
MAEGSGLALGLWLCRAGLRRAGGRILDAVRLRRMAAVNGDIMVRSILLQGSFTTFLFMAAGQGDVVLASNQVLLQFLEVMAYVLDGFAFSAETLVGQATGAKSAARLSRAVRVTGVWGVGGAVGLGAMFALIGPAAIDLMTTAPEVRETARLYLPWVALAPVVGIAGWMLDGVFIGATRTAEMRNAMLVSVAVYALALWATLDWGNHGLWVSLMVLYVLRGLTLGAYYPRVVMGARA